MVKACKVMQMRSDVGMKECVALFTQMLEAITADDTLFPQQSFLELQMLCVPLVVSAKDFCLKNSFNVRTLLERHSPSLIAYDSVAGVASKLSSSAVNIDKVIRMMSEMKETPCTACQLALRASSRK